MGVELILMPLRRESRLQERVIRTFDRVTLETDYEIFAQIADKGKPEIPETELAQVVRTKTIPKGSYISLYTDKGLREVSENPNHTPISYTTPREMRKINFSAIVDISPRNKASILYLRQLPENTPIILYWNQNEKNISA